jgi:hypothetical protein
MSLLLASRCCSRCVGRLGGRPAGRAAWPPLGDPIPAGAGRRGAQARGAPRSRRWSTTASAASWTTPTTSAARASSRAALEAIWTRSRGQDALTAEAPLRFGVTARRAASRTRRGAASARGAGALGWLEPRTAGPAAGAGAAARSAGVEKWYGPHPAVRGLDFACRGRVPHALRAQRGGEDHAAADALRCAPSHARRDPGLAGAARLRRRARVAPPHRGALAPDLPLRRLTAAENLASSGGSTGWAAEREIEARLREVGLWERGRPGARLLARDAAAARARAHAPARPGGCAARRAVHRARPARRRGCCAACWRRSATAAARWCW